MGHTSTLIISGGTVIDITVRNNNKGTLKNRKNITENLANMENSKAANNITSTYHESTASSANAINGNEKTDERRHISEDS